MNKFVLILGISLLLFSNSCRNPVKVTFSSPQPSETKDLKRFPERLIGEYYSIDGTYSLIISKKIMEKKYEYYYKIDPNDLDSNEIIQGNFIINLNTNEKIPFKKVQDSLEVHELFIDTVFNLNQEDILRKYKGYYFLNMTYNDFGWEVQKLYLKKGKLYISQVLNESEITQLKELSQSFEDTIPTYKFNIDKSQFKKFVKSEGFGSTDTLIKL